MKAKESRKYYLEMSVAIMDGKENPDKNGIKIGDKFSKYNNDGSRNVCKVLDVIFRRSALSGKELENEYLVKDSQNRIFNVKAKIINATKHLTK